MLQKTFHERQPAGDGEQAARFISDGSSGVWVDSLAQNVQALTLEGRFRANRHELNVDGAYLFWSIRSLQDLNREGAARRVQTQFGKTLLGERFPGIVYDESGMQNCIHCNFD